MMRHERTLFGFFALALAATLLPRPAAAQSGIGLAPGTTPEPVVLEDLDGAPVDLGEIIGEQPALVEFWAEWCHGCRALDPQVSAAHERFGDRVAFVQVAVAANQDPESIRAYRAEHPTPVRVLWDGENEAARAFEAPGTAYVVALDADGRVVYTGQGPNQDIEAAIEKALP